MQSMSTTVFDQLKDSLLIIRMQMMMMMMFVCNYIQVRSHDH